MRTEFTLRAYCCRGNCARACSQAQFTIGDNLDLTANGTINVGYNDTYGNDIDSSHGLGFGGTAALNGFFYNPNFVSFNINPYSNQSRSNSGIGSVSDASGVTLIPRSSAAATFPARSITAPITTPRETTAYLVLAA